jgi:hypothetical protein
MELRPYQDEIAKKATKILKECGFVYLSMEVRTGKTITALETAYNFGAERVLFITKIKAFSSIKSDYDNIGYLYNLTIINKESLHTIEENDFDVVIIDEAHGLAAFPKASKYQKDIRKRFSKKPIIFLSGTPTPESFSQWYHQLQVTEKSPFKQYTNFYKWANDFVNVTEQNLGYARVKVYKDGIESKILPQIQPYIITFTQAQAGFTSEVNEHILECPMEDITYDIIKRLKRDKIVQGKSGLILGDTGVKLMQKVHQLSSGTCKFEDGTSMVIDYSKAKFIKWKFENEKIAIFYKFKEELNALRQVYGAENLTEDLDEFNTTNKVIALQIISGREGISLKNAKYLVYYNIDFSATSYWQSRDRLTTMDRNTNDIYWIFSKGNNSIERNIYKSVMSKKNYTLSNFKRDYYVDI